MEARAGSASRLAIRGMLSESFIFHFKVKCNRPIFADNRPPCLQRKRLMNTNHNIGVASQIGKYSDAVEIPAGARWLVTSGTPGLALDGTLPDGIAAQSELAWRHIVMMLEHAGMTINDMVKMTHYLTKESDIAEYVQVRSRFIGDARPASVLMVIPGLVRPGFLVEIEVLAAKS
jgi:2-iminobutanoate/2-iminopropanoate deaminase